MNGNLDYEKGVSDERSRCKTITEFWNKSSYIGTRYGNIDAQGMEVLLRVVKLIEEDIDANNLPGRT